MTDSPEQTEFRRHLREMRSAAGGVSQDLEIWFKRLDQKIDAMPKNASKEFKYFVSDLNDDFHSLARAIDRDMSAVPGHIASGLSDLKDATVAAGAATRDAFHTARKASAEATKNTLAKMAGVKKTPMKEWRNPGGGSSGSTSSASAPPPDDTQ